MSQAQVQCDGGLPRRQLEGFFRGVVVRNIQRKKRIFIGGWLVESLPGNVALGEPLGRQVGRREIPAVAPPQPADRAALYSNWPAVGSGEANSDGGIWLPSRRPQRPDQIHRFRNKPEQSNSKA